MSYNLYVEGDLDYFALSRSTRYLESIEMFPIEPNGLGIALPSSRVDDHARDELRRVITELLAAEATIYDLMSGNKVTNVDALLATIFG